MDESISENYGGKCRVGKTVFQERSSERICEQGGVVEVSKISSRDRMLQCTRQMPMKDVVEALPVLLSARKDEFLARTGELEGLLDDCAQKLDALKRHQYSWVLLPASSVTRNTTRRRAA